MARYIDADAVKNDGYLCYYDSKGNAYYDIDHAPTVDVAEVEWKAIDGYEGLYEVSTLGQVRNSKGLILKPYLKHAKYTSYKKVALWKDGEYKHFYIHRLVAQAFIPNDNNLPIINHKDEDGTNNLVSNLEWCNRSYNATYGSATERLKGSIKDKIIPVKQREKISSSMKKSRRENAKVKIEYHGKMMSIPELAEELNVKQETLRARYRRTGSVFLDGAKMDGGNV